MWLAVVLESVWLMKFLLVPWGMTLADKILCCDDMELLAYSGDGDPDYRYMQAHVMFDSVAFEA